MARLKDDGLLVTDEGLKLIASNVMKVVNEVEIDPTINATMEALGFTDTKVTRPDGIMKSLKGVLDLEEVGELDELPLLQDSEGPSKGYKLKRYGGKKAISRATMEWFKKAKQDDTLPTEVKDEITNLTLDVARLGTRNKKAKNFAVTRLLVNGFTNNAEYGDGSSTPYGKPLFATDHPVGETGATQSNLVTGALTQVNLEAAIDKLRKMKDQLGTTIGFAASSYTLIVGPNLEATARKILNDGSIYASQVNDVAVGNDVTMSIFQWEGFKVRLFVLPTMGQPSVNGTIGTGNEWFVLNHELASELEAFRFISLYDAIIDSYTDQKSKVTYLDIDTSFTVDFYNPEVIVGSQG